MTCSTILDQLLEADLSELTSTGDTPIAVHLRGCARCRSVADRVVHDTHALGLVVLSAARAPLVAPSRPRGVITRRAWVVGLSGVAATILGLAVRGLELVNSDHKPTVIVMQPVGALPPDVKPSVESHSPASAVIPHFPAAKRVFTAPRSRARRHRDLATAVVATAVRVEPTLALRADRPVPVAPVRLDVEPRPTLGSDVSVEPQAGKRASIIRTRRADVTVVWLY
jgi:hypothetical protein